VPLSPPTLSAPDTAERVEAALRDAIAAYRTTMPLPVDAGESLGSGGVDARRVVWDGSLERQMGMALYAYETERLSGAVVGGDDFAAAIRRSTPRGWAFRGFPVLFNHASPARMMAALLQSPPAAAILSQPWDGDAARSGWGVRVAVHVYPEDTVGVWVMVACRNRVRTIAVPPATEWVST